MRELIQQALKRRAPLFNDTDTTCFRVVDGAADGLPGITIDHFNGHWLVETVNTPFPEPLRTWRPACCTSVYWKARDQQNKGAPEWIGGECLEAPFIVIENRIRFEINFQSGYSQGLFLDQRENRQRVRERVGQGDCVLNCFAYTCGFSVAAALGNAVTTSLDLSGTYLDWGKRHFRLNGIDDDAHFFCKGDTLEWMKRFAKQGRTFQGIVLDPPTFSRNRKGKVFQASRDYHLLVDAAVRLLSPGGWLLCSCNDRRFTATSFEQIVRLGCANAGCRAYQCEPLKMPADFSGERYLQLLWLTLGERLPTP